MRGYGLLALTFLFAAVGFVLARIFSDVPEPPSDASSSVVSLVRNVSWNTEYADNVPFQKGDELQYYYIIRSDAPSRARFDLNSIRASFEVRSVTVDGVPIAEDGTADLSDVSTVRMDVVAKDSSGEAGPDPSSWLSYSPIGGPIGTAPVSAGTGTSASGMLSSSGASGIPAHPEVALLENEISIGPDTLLDPRVDHLLRLSGDSVARLSSIAAGDKRLQVRAAGDERFVVVPAREFAPGAYFVAFEYDARFLRSSDLSLRFADYPDRSVEVHDVTPRSIPSDHAANIVLQGRGFDRVVSIQLNNTYILKSTEFTRINDRVMVVEVPEGLDPGAYFLNIMLPNEIV